MSSIIVYFPDGTREFVYPANALNEGDSIWHDGARYRILSIVQNDGLPLKATVEPDTDGLGSLLTSEKGALRLVPVEASLARTPSVCRLRRPRSQSLDQLSRRAKNRRWSGPAPGHLGKGLVVGRL